MEKSILVVEDDPQDEALLLRAFRKTNLRADILFAYDGEEALEYVLGTAKKPDGVYGPPSLVMLDLKMPKMGGLETLRILRQDPRSKYIPVVVFTSSTMEQDMKDSFELGANSFVSKPIDFDQLVRVLGQIGSYWLTLNHSPA